MKKSPLISVIVPVYNVADYLAECLSSILNQTYKNFEVICINDGSTDNSGKICDEFAEKDSRFKVFHKVNEGISKTRNFGINHSNGEYLTFIDSDDYISDNYLEYLYDLICKYDTVLAVAAHRIVYNSKNRKYKGIGLDKEITLSQKECLNELLLDNVLDISPCVKLYSRNLFNDIRYPDNLIFEDTATTYKFFLLTDKTAIGGNSIYNYRIRPSSITTTISFKNKMQLIQNTRQMCSDIVAKYPDLSDAAERKIVWSYFSTLNQLLKSSDRKNFRKEEKEIVAFLKGHKKQILKNKEYSKRDKLASLALSFGVSFYSFIWKIYSKIAKS